MPLRFFVQFRSSTFRSRVHGPASALLASPLSAAAPAAGREQEAAAQAEAEAEAAVEAAVEAAAAAGRQQAEAVG